LLLKKLKNEKLPAFTLGVEEEYQIIDPETRDLRSHLSKIVDGAKVILNELKQNAPVCRGVGTNICMNVKQKELKFLRTKIVELADKQGLIVGGAGTHPFQNGKTNRSLMILDIIL
jgi:carboxylate-amine ligase